MSKLDPVCLNPAQLSKRKGDRAVNLAADIRSAQQRTRRHPDFVMMTRRRRIWLDHNDARRLGSRVGYAYANLVLLAATRSSRVTWYACAIVQNGEFFGSSTNFNMKKK